MLVTDTELMLVNPDMNRLGCGIVKFVAFLQVGWASDNLCLLTNEFSPSPLAAPILRMWTYPLTLQITVHCSSLPITGSSPK